jgi:hypothetical protein
MWPVSPQLRTFGLHSRMSALFWHTSSRNDDMHMIKYDLTTRSTDFATHIPHRAFIPSRSDHLIRPNSCPQPGQEHRPCQHLSHFRKDRSAQRVTLFAYRSNLQHSHYHHRSMASVYHQTLAPPFFPTSRLHLPWIFERSSSAQTKNIESGWKHPRPFDCNMVCPRMWNSKSFTLETKLDYPAHDCRLDRPEPPTSLKRDTPNFA